MTGVGENPRPVADFWRDGQPMPQRLAMPDWTDPEVKARLEELVARWDAETALRGPNVSKWLDDAIVKSWARPVVVVAAEQFDRLPKAPARPYGLDGALGDFSGVPIVLWPPRQPSRWRRAWDAIRRLWT